MFFFVSRCSLYISGSLGMADGLSFDVFFVCFFLNGVIVVYICFWIVWCVSGSIYFLLMNEAVCAW